MPRKAREKSDTGIYHIVMRGINRQSIFEDEEDYEKFLQTLERYKDKSGYEIYAYCLMGNHVHLLIKTGKEPLEQVMRRVCGSYVYWFNWKYKRVGNLFQDRFKSEAVENDAYFLTVQRYIHQNPIKSGIVANMKDYHWSSYQEYVNRPKLIERAFLFKMFADSPTKAKECFIQYNNEIDSVVCLDLEEKGQISDDEAREIIKNACGLKYAPDLEKMEREKRNEYLKELKEVYNLSIRQIERLTGVNRGTIQRV